MRMVMAMAVFMVVSMVMRIIMPRVMVMRVIFVWSWLRLRTRHNHIQTAVTVIHMCIRIHITTCITSRTIISIAITIAIDITCP